MKDSFKEYVASKLKNLRVKFDYKQKSVANKAKIIVINPPSDEHQEELLKEITEFIQDKYYS